MKLHFLSSGDDAFAEDLRNLSARVCRQYRLTERARAVLWLKLILYTALFITAYLRLILHAHSSKAALAAAYTFVGMSGILLAFNAAHDAVHSTFSKNRTVNRVIYSLTFNLQGMSAYLWRIRHLTSHHVFPNVDGCDADIDDNPFLRLSPHGRPRWYHRYQHLYASLLYAVYTLHWLLIKDVIYLRKKDLANLHNQHHSGKSLLAFIGWKIFYGFYMLLLPAVMLKCSLWWIITGFVFMHAVISVFFVLTLIISHLCEETHFPVADEAGRLPYTFHQHQLAVSMDYHAQSRVASWIFGGFNSHAAHHLFPRLPHPCYPVLSKVIRKVARRHGYPYNELSIPKAVRSHYRYLRQVGRSDEAEFSGAQKIHILSFAVLAALTFLPLVLYGQRSYRDRAAETLATIGVVDCPVKLTGINRLLSASGYPALVNNLATISFGLETESVRDSHFSADINYQYSTVQRKKSEAYSTAIAFHSVRLGVGRQVAARKAFTLAVQPGISILLAKLQCFSQLTDTTSLSNYLSAQPADEKSFSLTQACFDLRTTLDWRMREQFLIQLIGGYQIPFGRPYADHYRGSFGEIADTRLAGFYLGLRVGFHEPRIPPAD